MRKLCRVIILLTLVTLILGPSISHAFNSATHIYIAEQVFPKCSLKTDLYYGSIAPDLALQASREKWPTSFYDTHYKFIDLRPSQWSPVQKAFAMGWLTHNELWGADYYAHGVYPTYNGYVNDKAAKLADYITDTYPEFKDYSKFAHYIIEVAIDFLLKEEQDSRLGVKLLKATLFRSWEDRLLMTKVMIWDEDEKVTQWITLVSAELTFRNLVARYAWALALSNSEYMYPLADLGVQLAGENGIPITQGEALEILGHAVGLCQGDYWAVINAAIEGIRPYK
jgi:hypothetical protein